MRKDQWTFWPHQCLLCYAFLIFLPFYHYIMTFFVPCYHFALRFIFWGHKHDYTCFLLFTIRLEYHLQFFHFESVCVFRIETSVLKTPCSSVLIFNPSHHPVPFDLVSSIHLHLRWLLIYKNILLRICLLSFDCFISPLFLFTCALSFQVVIFHACLLSFPLYVCCLCSRFLFSEYYEVCIENLSHSLNRSFPVDSNLSKFAVLPFYIFTVEILSLYSVSLLHIVVAIVIFKSLSFNLYV